MIWNTKELVACNNYQKVLYGMEESCDVARKESRVECKFSCGGSPPKFQSSCVQIRFPIIQSKNQIIQWVLIKCGLAVCDHPMNPIWSDVCDSHQIDRNNIDNDDVIIWDQRSE